MSDFSNRLFTTQHTTIPLQGNISPLAPPLSPPLIEGLYPHRPIHKIPKNAYVRYWFASKIYSQTPRIWLSDSLVNAKYCKCIPHRTNCVRNSISKVMYVFFTWFRHVIVFCSHFSLSSLCSNAWMLVGLKMGFLMNIGY